jgi:aspartyl-tRNA(Asn)/glutamyl-tRNA(Gln) amidotransferase subunit C
MPGGCGFLDSPVVADPISRADVEHVAKLARLALTDAEIEDLTAELGSILGHADDIEALALDDVPPTAHPLPLENVLRADDVRPTLDRDEVLAQAPAAEDGRFRVPRILGEAP